MDVLTRLERTTTAQLLRFANKLNSTGRGRSEREMDIIFKNAHFPIDGFSTFFRGIFPVVRLTLKNWMHPVEVRRVIRDLVPLRNDSFPWEMVPVGEYTQTVPNVLFCTAHVGVTQTMHFQFLNRGSVLQANGKQTFISFCLI